MQGGHDTWVCLASLPAAALVSAYTPAHLTSVGDPEHTRPALDKVSDESSLHSPLITIAASTLSSRGTPAAATCNRDWRRSDISIEAV
ncbi:hypothetical protein BCV69DRAFT_284075 [Microstroma glucosiphilum]|uniref:Secreted protein n=1 Tax=Pseudomicrostroma glucosiphilum TaxID=1684307 RepID=A0A316U8Y2_9BASI|nr:hypothetical protein BCV69DRAFT_284075 [Pseudomicrostroma glucosiphilum]PWN19445.1 hypothetical protein BCV69DRAFT_284075 [Pseudomicrostroma glucosiphilum]